MTTNERFSRKNDGDNPSVLLRTMTENENNISALLEDTTAKEDSLLRTTFMGPKNGTCMGNCFSKFFNLIDIGMCTHKPPSQKQMKKEFI